MDQNQPLADVSKSKAAKLGKLLQASSSLQVYVCVHIKVT